MRVWRWILLLVIVATLVAFGWHWVAEDPGYVLLRLRGWRIETTLVAAVLILLLAWALLTAAWRLLRWPFGAFSRRHRRLSQQRMGDGLIALIEGRHGDAERDLNRASRLDSLRGPALLAAAEAASRRGEHGRALEALNQASQSAPQAARVLRARVLRREGKPAEALALLIPEADKGTLTPGGWRELALAALAHGDIRRARQALDPLQKSGALGSRAYATLEAQVLTATLHAAPDGASLNTLWSQLPKAQRHVQFQRARGLRPAADQLLDRGQALARRVDVDAQTLRRQRRTLVGVEIGQEGRQQLRAALLVIAQQRADGIPLDGRVDVVGDDEGELLDRPIWLGQPHRLEAVAGDRDLAISGAGGGDLVRRERLALVVQVEVPGDHLGLAAGGRDQLADPLLQGAPGLDESCR